MDRQLHLDTDTRVPTSRDLVLCVKGSLHGSGGPWGFTRLGSDQSLGVLRGLNPRRSPEVPLGAIVDSWVAKDRVGRDGDGVSDGCGG